jgi:hypothetical protein
LSRRFFATKLRLFEGGIAPRLSGGDVGGLILVMSSRYFWF